jgi:hypothetical protein
MCRHFSSTVYVLEKLSKVKITLFSLRVEKAHGRAFSTRKEAKQTDFNYDHTGLGLVHHLFVNIKHYINFNKLLLDGT